MVFDPVHFEQQVERFLRARARRAVRHSAGLWPGLDLDSLYADFPSFTSHELYAELQEAQFEDEKRQGFLVAFLAAAHLEGRTRGLVEQAAQFETRRTITVADGDEVLPWRSAPPRWTLSTDVARRHELNAGWRAELRTGLNATLARWQDELWNALQPLLPPPSPGRSGGGQSSEGRAGRARPSGGGPGVTSPGGDPSADEPSDWLAFWTDLRGINLEGMGLLSDSLLTLGADLYRNTLQVYLAQQNLPLGDAWAADADFAFRAPRFDNAFPPSKLLPTLVRTFRDLGIELEDQLSRGNIRFDREPRPTGAPGLHCLPLDVPREVHLLYQSVGGFQDYAHALHGLGQAQHYYHADPTFPPAYRWLGDATTTLAYGSLLEGLVLDRTWLRERLEYDASNDFLIVGHLWRQYRLRGAAARCLYERRLWRGESRDPTRGGLGADYEDLLTGATHMRHFAEEHLFALLLPPAGGGWVGDGAPWATLAAAVELRAAVFAAQLRLFLRREYDAEWYRNRRAGRFLVQELWRPGRRHTAEELLGYMGYEGFDPAILWQESVEVLASV